MSCTIEGKNRLARGPRMLRQSNGACFVLLRVSPKEPPAVKRLLDAAAARVRFRTALLGRA